MARTMLYRKPLAHTDTVISSPAFSARHQYTVRTVVFVSVPTLRTAAKSWVPSKARAASAMRPISRGCGQKQAPRSIKGSRMRLLWMR